MVDVAYTIVKVGSWSTPGSKLQLWDLTVDCKHTDDHKWKSASNKEEICKKGYAELKTDRESNSCNNNDEFPYLGAVLFEIF
jgi:hypothetical protein